MILFKPTGDNSMYLIYVSSPPKLPSADLKVKYKEDLL